MTIVFLIEKRKKNALYKIWITANRTRCVTENVWCIELPRLRISVQASYVVDFRIHGGHVPPRPPYPPISLQGPLEISSRVP